jgi:hypothetical protein
MATAASIVKAIIFFMGPVLLSWVCASWRHICERDAKRRGVSHRGLARAGR